MDVHRVTNLRPGDVAPGRPFAHPSHIPVDVNSLRYMVDQLCLFLENPRLYSHLSRPIIVHRPGPEEWIYRLVVAEPEQLLERRELSFVGFLGQRRNDADVALADEFDELLVGEIPETPGLLSYSTMALISGNFSNLVIFAHEEVKALWSRSRAHAQAVGKLAPRYYHSVRLYNGLLTNGLSDSRAMHMARVKYFDYQEMPVWQAVREFPEGWDGRT